MRRSLSSWVKSLFPTAPTRPIRKLRSLALEQLETRDCPTVLPPGGPEPPPPGPGFPPQANPDHFTFAADTPIRISITDLLANDTAAPGVPLTVELLDNPVGGQLDLIDVGLWEYTPGTGFSGSDAFSYRLFDGTDYSLPALVTFEQQPAATSTPATPTVIDVTEAWLAGFEDETLGSVTVAVFETAEADVLDWTASIDWGDGTTTTGQIVADGDGRYRVVGEHTYDEWGLYLVQVTLTDTAEVTHDLFNLASIQFRNYTYTFTDPVGNSTQFVFAEGWRLTQEIDPLGNSTFYSYTSDGLLASRTDRLGRAITFDYGPDGVLVGQTWLAADGLTVVDTLSFSYASNGLLLSASNGVGAYTFSWDDGQLLGVTNPFGVTLTFGYDADGRRTSVADSFGGLITSTYTDGLLASRTLTAGALNLRGDLAYDSDDRLSQVSRFAGPLQELVSQTEYAFAQGMLASITHRGAGGVILDQFLYQFDEDGFLSQITSDFAGETDYSYDSDGQLTGESSLLVTSTFSYDANGNRVGGGYVVGPGNRLLADGTWSYSYDAEGNLVGKTHLVTGDSWSYSYDHRNQMTLAEKRDATGAVVLLAVYKYDVFGNRIEKAVDWDGDGPNAAVVTRYVLDGWNNMKPTPIGNEHFDVVAELDGSNQLIARYLHGDEFDQTFARVRVDGSTPEVHWLLTDHLNSVRLVLDESGAVLDQIAYDAFGNIVAQLNPLLANPILFASREFDAETGLYYNRARYLDPTTGRWTTQDPLGFAAGDANLYRYVGNRATMATDPSGNIWYPGKYLIQYVRESRRGRELDAQLDEIQRRRYDATAMVMRPGGGTWSIRTGYGIADPAFERNWQQGMSDAAVLANIGAMWTANGPMWVSSSGHQFVWQQGRWWNRSTNRAATSAEAAAASRATSRLFGHNEYVVTNAAQATRVRQALEAYYRQNAPAGATIRWVDNVPGGRNGMINTQTGEILLSNHLRTNYPHLADGVLIEELLHFHQLYSRGWLGRSLTLAENALLEREVVQRILKSGFRIFDPR